MSRNDSTSKHIFRSNVCHTRQLNVREQSLKKGKIELKGQWLVEAGFTIDSAVTVRVMEQCIVLTPTPKRPQILKAFSQLTPANKDLIRTTIDLFLDKK